MPVFVNMRGVAHGGSNGMSLAFPDVCKTPGPAPNPIPIPYPNIAKASDVSDGPTSVTVEGKMPATKGAKYSRSSGDEAGSAGGGMVSNSQMDAAEFIMYSFDVQFEGNGVCRLGDPLTHNKKNAVG